MTTNVEQYAAIDAQVASAATAVASAGSNQSVRIDHVLLYNTTGSDVTVTFHRDTTGETPGTANILLTKSVVANSLAVVSELANLTLGAGTSLFASDGTGSQVNISVSGRRYS